MFAPQALGPQGWTWGDYRVTASFSQTHLDSALQPSERIWESFIRAQLPLVAEPKMRNLQEEGEGPCPGAGGHRNPPASPFPPGAGSD